MIVCCGEALIDMLPRESTAGEQAFAPYAGGAVFNSAIALGRLGIPVEFFSGLSTDLFGDVLKDTLAKSRVGARYAHLSARPTTLAFVRLTDGQASYLFYDENTAGSLLSHADLPELDADVRALLFGGISLITDPAASAYEALLLRESARRVIMLDPNIRASFIRDGERYRERVKRMIAACDILKISDEDLAWLGGVGETEDVVARWLELGPKLIVITRGGEGAIGYTQRSKVKVASRRVIVVDTVGAGDTFNAGLLASLSECGLLEKSAVADLTEAQIIAALDYGAKAAAVTVSRAGANPPWREELAQG